MNLTTSSLELLNAEKICSVIEPQNKLFLTQLNIFDTIDSTNSYLLTHAKIGALPGTVCLAEEQTAGRGRLGRHWYSPRGAAICCSLLWEFTTVEHFSSVSLAVAVMVLNTLKKYGIVGGLQLKWPNDILFNGRKLAGILLEQTGSSIVIGVGINLNLLTDADPSWISIHEIIGEDVKRNYLTGLLINELLAHLPIYQNRGLKYFMNDWCQYDVLFHRPIIIKTSEQTLSGIMEGINSQGELLLRDEENQVLAFSYGEVSVRLASK